ncbi:glycoside hydrolase family 3 C-terminal domain-containing protein [Allofournierella sp.]|uniref:glycoside hydrolase family 3 C-terminal domain-containing protein n=1 Tax=Allofournierella sp. TaxID=1940256 RepID=UPI003AB23AA5
MSMTDVETLLAEMTLEEKAGLCSGAGCWATKALKRLGIPAVMMADGPHGLRKQNGATDHLGVGESAKAVCFPTGAALGASFDRELLEQLGGHLGRAAAAERLHTVLGPAVNIKRGPLCGRNFEYLSEDPYLTGELGAAYVTGVQREQTGVSVKHFAANNQEQHRMSVDVQVSERALREIYLAGFETIVKQARPWAVMCSYNLINGTYSCENPWLLDEMLRKEWGFDGIVMTDWGAMNDRSRALEAGLELEMPSSHGESDRQLVQAVKEGKLPETVLDRAAGRLLTWVQKGRPCAPAEPYDTGAQHAFARRAAGECAVLLKNNGVLPLKKGARVAFIGEFAAAPRYQGGGSSHVNSTRVSCALQAAGPLAEIRYAQGFSAQGGALGEGAFQAAVQAAAQAECAVVFAGLPDSWESEGYDRADLELPPEQNALIAAVAAAQPKTVVVLHNGSPVAMPWLQDVAAVLEMYLAGEAVGEATADLLFGAVNPSGKLAETFPLRLQDTPCYLNFPGDGKTVDYHEDIYVGYRWYDAREMPVLFPFGHGLSYTSFTYTGIALDKAHMDDSETLTATVRVKNTGGRTGKEVVQLYVHPGPDTGPALRARQELKGFAKVELAPGEEKAVQFRLNGRSFAYYEPRLAGWHVPSGIYTVSAGGSSHSLPLHAQVRVGSRQKLPLAAQETTTVGDVLALGSEAQIAQLNTLLKKTSFYTPESGSADPLGSGTRQFLGAMASGLPLHALRSFGDVCNEEIERLLGALSTPAQKGGK